jgi:iron complex outermembrane recepter protein
VRANFVWEPSDTVSATLFAQYDDQEKLGDSSTPDTDTATGALEALDPRFDPGVDDSILHFTGRGRGGEPFSALEALRSSLTVDFDIGAHTLTSVTAYSDNEDQFALDLDFYVLNGAAFTQEATFDQVTQEIRLASDPGQRFDYIVGAFYYDLEWDRVFRSIVDPDPRSPTFAIPATRMATIPYNVQTQGISVFGQFGARLADRLELGGSLRWTTEDKDARVESVSNFPAGLTPVPLTFESRTSEPLDWSVNMNFDFTDDVLGYALVSRGTKTGAFADITNNVAINPATGRPSNEVRDEESTTYELGLKTTWMNGAATLNGSIWHMDVKDFQESVVIAGVFLTSNQDYVSDGVELQGTWRAADGLQMSGTVTYADAVNETPPAFVPPIPTASEIPSLRAPEWTASFDVLYERPLSGTELTWDLGSHVYYRDQYWNAPLISVQNFRSYSDEITLLDLDIGLRHQSGWGVSLMAKNVTDEAYCDHGTLTNFLGADNQRVCFSGLPRTFMVRASFDF